MIKHRRYVYRLTFPDGMLYFGSTYSVEERWANNGIHYKGQPVYEAIEKCGWENVKKEIVLYLSNNNTLVKEVELALIRDNKDKCYNAQGNAEWATANPPLKGNTASYKYVWTIDGVTKTAKDWCIEYGKPLTYVCHAGFHGMTPKEVLTFPKIPPNMAKRALEYWASLGYFPGTDTTSYITPKNEIPSWIPLKGGKW